MGLVKEETDIYSMTEVTRKHKFVIDKRKGLGSFLKLIRQAKNESRTFVSTKTGIPAAFIRNLENEESRLPSPDRLKKISKHFGISIQNLLYYAGYFDNLEE